MSSPEKRRPPPGTGTGPKGASGRRSPSRTSRAPPNNTTRSTAPTASSNSQNTNTTLIAPPPRAALSGTSSPAPDNPRNNNTTNNNTLKDTSNRPASPAYPAPTPSQPPTPAGSSALALAASALREKDVRIASLERELALMETEFAHTLDRLSTAESETAAFWQGKCARLERELELARASSSQGYTNGGGDQDGEEGDREEEMRELRRGWEAAREALARRDEEILGLRAQVRGLKEWVSVSTRSDGQAQTSDEVFGEGMARLGNGLQNWVLVNFRRAKIDLSGADEDAVAELGRLVPMYEELASTSKIHLLQSVVSRVLVELVFDAYFAGLPTEMAEQLKQVETLLASCASSPESINQWRSLTLTILKKDMQQSETSTVTDTIVSKLNNLLNAITNTTSTDARDQGLQALINSAIELSRLLAVQKAVFKIEMPEILPHQRILFDAETMEDIGGEDEDSLTDREICCVTFPGIVKRGDESGGHLQFRNVISKARVLCSPE